MNAVVVDFQGVAIQEVVVTDDSLTVELVDGRSISVPLAWYPRLYNGTTQERDNWRLIGRGVGIHWPDLDEDLSVAGIILGRPSNESHKVFATVTGEPTSRIATLVEASIIQSERLDLISMTPDFLKACLARDLETAATLIGLTIPLDWLDSQQLMQIRLDQLRRNPSLQLWLLRAVSLRQSKMMVGHIGFHTQPGPTYLQTIAPGGAEIGYSIYPPFRRQGYAREACGALMEWAYREQGVSRFVVSISPDNAPSIAIARHFGFQKVREHDDEEDWLEHVFVLQRTEK